MVGRAGQVSGKAPPKGVPQASGRAQREQSAPAFMLGAMPRSPADPTPIRPDQRRRDGGFLALAAALLAAVVALSALAGCTSFGADPASFHHRPAISGLAVIRSAIARPAGKPVYYLALGDSLA